MLFIKVIKVLPMEQISRHWEQNRPKMRPMEVFCRHWERSGRDGKLLLLQNLFDKRIQGVTVKVAGKDCSVRSEKYRVRDAGYAIQLVEV